MEDKPKPKYRMGIVGIVILILLATIADLLSLIPFVGDFVGPIFWVMVSIYLWKIGCGLINSKRLATEIISIVIEVIPVAQEIPSIIICMAIIIILVRVEDKTGIKMIGSKGNLTNAGRITVRSNAEGVRESLQSQRKKLENGGGASNQDGIRAPNGAILKNN
jgi:hypothetical protein